MAGTIRIVTDSAADLLPETAQKYGISVVPLSIRFDETEYTDGVQLSREEFWQKLANSTDLPSTAAPSPGAFAETFRKAKQDGADAVVCICLSSKLSGTYQSAVQGAKDVENEIAVRVIDSQSCAIAQQTLCIEAAQLAESGATTEEIVDGISKLNARLHLFAAFDTLEYLRKGGRIGAAGAFFGSLLSVKPIVTLKDGEVQPDSRQRTRNRALEYLVKLVAERTPIDHVTVAHSNASDLDKFLDMLAPITPKSDIQVSLLGPVVGTHTGPGLLAVCFASS